MFCTSCRTRLPDDARFCSGCGTATAQAAPPTPLPASAAAPRALRAGQPIRGWFVLFVALLMIGYAAYRMLAQGWVPHGMEWIGFALWPLWVREGVRRLRGEGQFGRGWRPAPGSRRPGFLVTAAVFFGGLFMSGNVYVFVVNVVLTALFLLLFLLVKRKHPAPIRPLARMKVVPIRALARE